MISGDFADGFFFTGFLAGSITVAIFWFRSCNFRVYTQEGKQCVKGNPKKVRKWHPMKTVILSFLSSGGQSTWKMSFRLWSNFPSWVLSKSLWTRALHSIGCHGLSTHSCFTTAKFNIDSWTISSTSPKKTVQIQLFILFPTVRRGKPNLALLCAHGWCRKACDPRSSTYFNLHKRWTWHCPTAAHSNSWELQQWWTLAKWGSIPHRPAQLPQLPQSPQLPLQLVTRIGRKNGR